MFFSLLMIISMSLSIAAISTANNAYAEADIVAAKESSNTRNFKDTLAEEDSAISQLQYTQRLHSSQISSTSSSMTEISTSMTEMSASMTALDNKINDFGIECSDTFGVLSGDAVKEGPSGHGYQYVKFENHIDGDFSNGITFFEAQLEAMERCWQGKRGYLTTITSAEENEMILSIIPEADRTPNGKFYNFIGWIGGSDAQNEGSWQWIEGPDLGTAFWNGGSATMGGAAIDGVYNNWYCDTSSSIWPYCEPNDSVGGAGQDCLNMYGDGTWNDVSCSIRANAYIVEFGDDVIE